MYVSEISFYIGDEYCTQIGGGVSYNAHYIDGKLDNVSYILMSGITIDGKNYQSEESKTLVSFEFTETEVGVQTLFMGENIHNFSCKYNDKHYKYAYGAIKLERRFLHLDLQTEQQDISLTGAFDMTLVWKDNDKILPNDTIYLTDGKFYFSHFLAFSSYGNTPK